MQKHLVDTTLDMFSELITRIDKLEGDLIEANSKLDAREQEILDLYARIDSLEARLEDN